MVSGVRSLATVSGSASDSMVVTRPTDIRTIMTMTMDTPLTAATAPPAIRTVPTTIRTIATDRSLSNPSPYREGFEHLRAGQLWPTAASAISSRTSCTFSSDCRSVATRSLRARSVSRISSSSFACSAAPSRFWVFWIRNTIRKVTMVVPVLMISLPDIGIVAQRAGRLSAKHRVRFAGSLAVRRRAPLFQPIENFRAPFRDPCGGIAFGEVRDHRRESLHQLGILLRRQFLAKPVPLPLVLLRERLFEGIALRALAVGADAEAALDAIDGG